MRKSKKTAKAIEKHLWNIEYTSNQFDILKEKAFDLLVKLSPENHGNLGFQDSYEIRELIYEYLGQTGDLKNVISEFKNEL